MAMDDVIGEIGELRIIPVVVIDDSDSAVPLARALCEGGLPLAEVTFRTDAAESAIKSIARSVPEVLVGAGTVLTTEQASRAIGAGARFIVSPGFNPRVVEFCLDRGLPVIPGCITPTEIGLAVELGLDVVKFFPAEACGGIPYLNAISAPFAAVKFVPTGGITSGNMNTYLSSPKVIACGGTWLAERTVIREGAFDEITRITREAVEVSRQVRRLE